MPTVSIQFPCAYPIKIIGEADRAGIRKILEVVRRHAPEVTPDDVSYRDSRHGNYQSIRVNIRATGEPQLKALHSELMQIDVVRLVL